MSRAASLLERAATRLAPRFEGDRRLDFTAPAGEDALAPSDGVTWQVFRNPIALFAGGVAAVVLELAEPRVRSGVWDHTTFRTDPVGRMQRTGLAAMVTVYGPKSMAETMIAGVCRKHDRIHGTTPDGVVYHANDPELLTWVHATASFGFLEAYRAYVRPLDRAQRDRFYAEGLPAARLYGAVAAPRSQHELDAQFAAMMPKLERSQIVLELLDILRNARILPRPLRSLQWMLVRAGVALVPEPVRARLGLGPRFGVSRAERVFVRALGRLADLLVLPSSPAAEARRRLGLPAW